MTHNATIKPAGSLIERAADMYDFARIAAPLTMPAFPASSTVVRPAIAPQQRPISRAAEKSIVPVDTDSLRLAGFVLPDAPPSALAEEFRLVKRQLLLSAFGGRKTVAVERGRAILMSSAQPNDGKTFCAVNLALSMATETDIDVLLVDADVAKPEVLSTLGLAGRAGLLDVLGDPAVDPEDLIIRTSIPQLSVLPAGRHTNNDTELLASDRTHGVIDALMAADPRRVIIFDTPPALAASAASVLSSHVGQAVCVVRADRTSDTELRETVALLAACPNVSLMLNGVSYAGNNQKYGSYYGYGG